MTTPPPVAPATPENAGLCERCRHAEAIASKRSVFLRCRLSDTDPSYARYPRLPMVACAGHEMRSGLGEAEG